MHKRGLSILVSVVLVIVITMSFIGCASTTTTPTTTTPTTTTATTPTTTTPQAPSEIKFGVSIALSGWLAADAEGQLLTNRLWVEEINKQGGVYVKDFDKRIPVRLIEYDDASDPAKDIQNYEKLILQDKVDILLPPFGTEWHFAVAPIIEKYGYPWMGTSITSEQLRQGYATYPHLFVIETQWPGIGDALVSLLQSKGVKTAASLFPNILYGVEGSGYIVPRLVAAGIEVPKVLSYAPDAVDLTPVLKQIKDANIEALLCASYLPDALLIIEQCKSIGYNPKVLFVAYGGTEPALLEKFGASTIEGIIAQGGWNPNDPKVIAWEKLFMDRWGKPSNYMVNPEEWASLEIWEQVLREVGLDREAQTQYIATTAFETSIYGTIKFENNYNTMGPNLSQWQGGKFLPISPDSWKQADVIYPKPAWP